jgi:mono/diheme cytochrome c family protein
MNRMAGICWFAALLVAVSAQTGYAQAAPEKTIWDGVYTDAQATRGQKVAQQNCGACHAPSEWSSSAFLGSWTGKPVLGLHSHIRNSMPFDSPGRLSSAQYSEIVAYMLKLNRAPAGQMELPSDDAALGKIGVTRRAAR